MESRIILLRRLSWLTVVVVCCCLNSLKASNIVAISHHTYSHAIQFVRIGQELAQHGHQFTLVVASNVDFQHDNISSIRIRRYQTILNDSFIAECVQQFVNGKQNLSSYCMTMLNDDCECLLKDRQLLTQMATGTDILVTDVTFRCSLIIEEILQTIPYHVGFSAGGFQDPIISSLYSIPTPPSYIPMMILEFTNKMTFTQRLQNFIIYISAGLLFEQVMDEGNQDLYLKYTNVPANRNYYTPMANILIMSTDFAIDYARPITPSVKVIGPIIPNQVSDHKVMLEIKQFLHSSPWPNFILISFGSHVSNFQFGIDYEQIASVLSKLPFSVIWRYSGAPLMNQANNTKTMTWIPQNNLLANPNCKLFITNAGTNSILEASYHGVPMLAVPIFGDQSGNAQRIQVAGIAKVLSLTKMNSKQLFHAIINITHDSVIKNNSQRISTLMQYKYKTSGISAVQEAAYWIEYAQLYDNAKHFRIGGFDLPWYQKDSLDVWLLHLTFIVIMYNYFYGW